MALRNERSLVAAALLLSLGVGLAVGYRAMHAAPVGDPTRDAARVRVTETGSLYRFVGTALTESQKKADAPVPSLGLTASDGTGLTLASLDAKAVVQGPLAFTEMRLVFDNPEDRVLEGTFRITLPQGAAISRFAMRIGDKWQEGEVVEKQAARQAYEDFLHRRQDPALLEQAAGNEFSARVFPIPARGRKELIVSFSQEITPEMPYRLSLRGLPAVGKLDALVAGTGDDAPILGQIHLEKTAPDRDLFVEPARLPKGDGVRAGELALLRVRPGAEAGADAFTSGVVLVDTSASRALGFEAQIALLSRTLGGLGNAKIVVAAFDQGIDLVYEGPAKDFESTGPAKLRERQAFGASDLGSALAWAGARARSLGAKRVLLVTDGVATAGETDPQKLRQAALALGAAGVERIDALAVGGIRDDDGLAGLCTPGLARDGVVIDGTRGESDAIRRLGAATRTVTVKVEGADWQYPEKLRGMQPGDEGLVYVKMLAGKTPRISFVEKGGATAPVEPKLSEIDRPLLERAWVTAKIAQLVQTPTEGKSEHEIKQEIIALSTTHRVLSPHTALLVLETERDYARYKINRQALADILTVEGTKLVRQKRTEDSALPGAVEAQKPQVARALEDVGFGKGGGGEKRDGAAPGGPAIGGAAPAPPPPRDRAAVADGRPPREAPRPAAAAPEARSEGAAEARADKAPVAAAAADPTPQATAAPAPMPMAKTAEVAVPSTLGASGGLGRGGDAPLAEPAAKMPPSATKAKQRRTIDDDWGDVFGSSQKARKDEKKTAAPAKIAQPSGPQALANRPVPTATATATATAPPSPPPFRSANSDAPPTPPKDKFGPYEGPMAGIMRALEAGDKTNALEKAIAFRAAAPGDVLALLALGEVFEAMGELRSAARAYGSIIDLFPARADLRRMAGERLERLTQDKARWAHSLAADSYEKAVAQRPDHPSSHRLLAYARLRAGDARGAFDAIEEGASRTYPSNRFAGVDRILREDAGILGAAWIKADPSRRDQVVDRLGTLGATIADKPSLRFVLMWETDNNDVDFHVHDGKGGHAYYGAKELPSGGSLFADVTTGYGPECFAITKNVAGRAAPYRLEAHYFSRGPMGYGMGKLEIIDHDGSGGLAFEERPYLIMSDRAYVQLGTYPGSQDDHGLDGTGNGYGDDPRGRPRPSLPRP